MGVMLVTALLLVVGLSSAAVTVAGPPLRAIKTGTDFVAAFQARARASSVNPCLVYTVQPPQAIVGRFNGSHTQFVLPEYPYDAGNTSYHDFMWISGHRTIQAVLEWNAGEGRYAPYGNDSALLVNNLLAMQGFPPCVFAGPQAFAVALVWDACTTPSRPAAPTAAFFLARAADPELYGIDVPAAAYRALVRDWSNLRRLTGCTSKLCVMQAGARDGDLKLGPSECGCGKAFADMFNALAPHYTPGPANNATTKACWARAKQLLAPKGSPPPAPAAFAAALRAAVHACEDASAYNSGDGLGWSDGIAPPGAADFPDGVTLPEFVIPQPSVTSLRAAGGLAAVMLGANSGYPKPCPAPPLVAPGPTREPAPAAVVAPPGVPSGRSAP